MFLKTPFSLDFIFLTITIVRPLSHFQKGNMPGVFNYAFIVVIFSLFLANPQNTYG